MPRKSKPTPKAVKAWAWVDDDGEIVYVGFYSDEHWGWMPIRVEIRPLPQMADEPKGR